jgi:hypothetical protein
MKRKITRQIEIEYEVDIDICDAKLKSMASDTQWVKGQINNYFKTSVTMKMPSLTEYCDKISYVEPKVSHRDKNLHVHTSINAKVVRDITVANEEVEKPNLKMEKTNVR